MNRIEKNLLKYAIPPVFWLGVWQLAAWAVGRELLLPGPLAVGARLLELARTADFWLSAGATLWRVFLGLFWGTLLGGALAFLTRFSPWADAVASPAVRVVRATPVVSFILLVYLWVARSAIPWVIAGLMVLPVVWGSLTAGLERIPAYIKTAADENIVEMALIENIQREDLNSIEIALAYQKLIDSYGLTQEKLSERVGKKRATIANYLRLLKLPAEIQVGLKDKKIDMGHARALLPVEDPEVQLALYEQILAEGLSVRNVEEIVRGGVDVSALEQAKKDKPARQTPKLPEEFNLLKDHLSSFFKTKVQLVCNEKGKGKITIPFASEDELEKLIGLLDKLK